MQFCKEHGVIGGHVRKCSGGTPDDSRSLIDIVLFQLGNLFVQKAVVGLFTDTLKQRPDGCFRFAKQAQDPLKSAGQCVWGSDRPAPSLLASPEEIPNTENQSQA